MLVLSYPRVTAQKTVPVYELSMYPKLEGAYQKNANMIPGPEIFVLEVTSIWGTCEYHILPCYWTEMRTVPQNGQTNWVTALDMVMVCSSESSLTAKLCTLDVRNLRLEVKPGEETILSSKVEIHPGGGVYELSELSVVECDGIFDCREDPAVQFTFLAGTAVGAEEENTMVSGSYVWSYDLYCRGKQIHNCQNITITQNYQNNAV